MYTLKHFSGIHGEKERLEGISPCVYDPVSILMHTKVRVAQLCPTLCDPVDYPGLPHRRWILYQLSYCSVYFFSYIWMRFLKYLMIFFILNSERKLLADKTGHTEIQSD